MCRGNLYPCYRPNDEPRNNSLLCRGTIRDGNRRFCPIVVIHLIESEDRMRHQATAQLTGDEKRALVDLAATHGKTHSTILRAGFREFRENPESQREWIDLAEKEATDCPHTPQN